MNRGLRCDAERHLKHSGLALAIYMKLRGVTWDKERRIYGTYYSSIQNLADYFGVKRESASRAVTELIESGWVEIVERRDPMKSGHAHKVEMQRSKDLHPITHDEWVEQHGDAHCHKALPMPWDNEKKDRLAIDLHRASKGHVKWYAGTVKGLRNTGALDDEILRAYQAHVAAMEKEPKTARGWQSNAWKFVADFKKLRLSVA